MTLRDDVYSKLSGTAAVTNLVGTRIYWQVIPQGATKPHIAYRKVGSPRLQYLGGPTGEEDCRMEVACFGDLNSDDAEDVAEAVRGALSGWEDLSVGVLRSDLVGEVDFYDDALEARQVSLDFQIVHRE